MFALAEIKSMNARACRQAARVEDNHNRQASFSECNGAVVLHSARLRDTVFLPPSRARVFLAKHIAAAASGVEAQNHLIESYFN